MTTRTAKDLMTVLDEWVEHFGARVMISRSVDLRRTPEEWSCVLTRVRPNTTAMVEQFYGHGMTQRAAVERALADAGVNPCATCGWAEVCEEGCHS